MRDGTGDLEKPRTVLFDLSRARLWSMTKYMQQPADSIHCYELVPNTIHPSEVCSAPALSDFAGWAIAERDREEALSKMKAAIIEGDFHVPSYPPFYPAAATLEIPRFGSLNISREYNPAHVGEASVWESPRNFDSPLRVDIPPPVLQHESGPALKGDQAFGKQETPKPNNKNKKKERRG
ncbi:hypothetical protein BDP81DRAFT_391475 [Colletotrichum phormii]|uniref:Uncharacterized protein n=1 Tax=Colletotrichum phormii TaxID=359342 RepID=A0AAI9ZWB6_9PEZI|nr:uncharacterized protein BDP81DRAFT_391475 [Colletotrichum phormii]KAK1639358.1 hypothetical protein BDP81DRAFT_391475 [Colletotrichum phormii]